MRIVGEPETFLWDFEEIAIELVIRVFVVKHGNPVSAGW